MLISQYKSRTGREKVIAKKEKGQRGPQKDAHLKTPSYVSGLTTVSAEKQSKRTMWFFVGPLPSPIVV